MPAILDKKSPRVRHNHKGTNQGERSKPGVNTHSPELNKPFEGVAFKGVNPSLVTVPTPKKKKL